MILLASFMSLGMMVILLAWMEHRFVSSNNPTKEDSAASCRANKADLWNLYPLPSQSSAARSPLPAPGRGASWSASLWTSDTS